MAKLLYLQASPRESQSFSIRVAQALLEEYRRAHPDDAVETLDLFETDLPAFKAPEAKAKYALLSGKAPAGEAEKAWQPVIEVIDRFKSADKYVIASAMWNFGIPYPLKHYIDVIVQPGLTFQFTPDKGAQGLVLGRPMVLCLARGGDYSEGSSAEGLDHQRTYLEAIFGYIGFEDIRSIVVQPTLQGGPEQAEKLLAAAMEESRRMGKSL